MARGEAVDGGPTVDERPREPGRRSLEPTGRAPYRLERIARPREPVHAGSRMLLWGATGTPPRLVVSQLGASPVGGLREVRLVDGRSGAVLGTARDARAVSARAGALEVRVGRRDGEGMTTGVMRLEDGALRVPSFALPDGRSASRTLLWLDPASEHIWCFARREGDSKGWFGLWSRLDETRLELERAIPFMPSYIRYNEGLDAVEVEQRPGPRSPEVLRRMAAARAERLERTPLDERPCGRVRITADLETDCVVPELERHVAGDAIWLDGPWVSFDADLRGERPILGRPTVVDTVSGRTHTLWPREVDCGHSFRTGLIAPPRVLVGCADETLSELRLRLWTPGGSYAWRVGRSWAERIWAREGDFTSLRDWPTRLEHPVLRVAHRGEAVETWLDLGRGVIFDSEPLRPLLGEGNPRRALAVRSGEGGVQDLVALDFERGAIDDVIRGVECPGELVERGREGARVVVACRRSTRRRSRQREIVWAELLDLEARARWRIDLHPAYLLDGGALVASERDEEPGRAETARAFYVLEPSEEGAE